jgi:hypothetical protein
MARRTDSRTLGGTDFFIPGTHETSRINKFEALFVDLFLEAHRQPPQQIILDLDASDDLLHGHQEGRFFHGYYDCYCYLPLYIFCGTHLLAANRDPPTSTP